MAAPLFGYLLTTQASFLVGQNVATRRRLRGAPPPPPRALHSFLHIQHAWQLFQFP